MTSANLTVSTGQPASQYAPTTAAAVSKSKTQSSKSSASKQKAKAQSKPEAKPKDTVKELKNDILDISTNSSKVLDRMLDLTKQGKLSDEDRAVLEHAWTVRSQIVTTMTNIYRMMADAAMAIIRNLRF